MNEDRSKKISTLKNITFLIMALLHCAIWVNSQTRSIAVDTTVVTAHTTTINGATLSYTATTGTPPVWDELGKPIATDQYVPYIRPQENGYKTDARWIALSNKNNNGLLFVSEEDQNLGFSALHIENEDFDSGDGLDYKTSKKLNHTIDIKERDLVQLNIDLGQRGVG